MRRGLTLLEVLVALAIASIVFAIVFLLYRTAATTALRQHEREQTAYAPAAALAVLRDDLWAAVPAALDTSNRLRLAATTQSDGSSASHLTFLAWQPDATNRSGRWYDTLRVDWSVWGPGTPAAVLARTAAVLTGPAGALASTNLFLPGLRSFAVFLHDGEKWQAAWPPPGANDQLPEPLSVRIALTYGETDASVYTDYPLPTGYVVTSSVPRSAKLAPR